MLSRHALLILFLSSFISTFIIFGFFAGRVATGYADSDELLTASYQWSLPHPSGFPLLVLITGFVMRLTTAFLNPAFAGNLTASVFHALALAFMSVTVVIILRGIKPSILNKSPLSIYFLIWLACVSFALTGYFWLYSGVLEVVSLTSLMSAIVVWCAVKWREKLIGNSHRENHLYFLLTWLCAGLSLSHIHTLVLLLPGLLLLLGLTARQWLKDNWYKKPLVWICALSLLICGFILPNLLIFWFDHHEAVYSWAIRPDFQGWQRYITRQDYAGYFPEESTSRPAYIAPLRPHFFTSQPDLVKYIVQNIGIFALILAVYGLILLYKRDKPLLWTMIAWLVVTGPLFIGYMGFPTYSAFDLEYFMLAGITYRQFLLHHFFWGLPFTLGVIFIYEKLLLRYTKYALLMVIVLLVFCLSSNFIKHEPIANQRKNNLSVMYAHSMLDSASPHSVIICSSDISCFSLMYASVVENYRPDVTVLTKNDLYIRDYLKKHPEFYGFTYHDNPYFLAHLIAWNLQDKRVYLANPTTYYIDYIGFNADPFYLVPTGYLYEVVTSAPQKLPSHSSYPVTDALIKETPPVEDHYRFGLRGYFASLHQTSGILYANYGDTTAAQKEFKTALDLFPAYQQAQDWLQKYDSFTPPERYAPGMSVDRNYLIEQYHQLKSENQLDAAYKILRKAIYLDPKNISLHQEMFDLYLQGDFFTEAQLEIDQITMLKPDSQIISSLHAQLATASAATTN